MTAEVKTVISQLNIAGGTWREDAPNQVAVREPQAADAPGVGKGDLFVLIEIHGPVANHEAVEHQLVQAIRDSYYLARGAVTAGLRRALQTAGDQLYHHNQKTGGPKKVTAGAIAVVMRGEEVFIAQIGGPSLFAVLSDLIRRYPSQSSRPGKAPPPQKPALGEAILVEPNLHHLYLEPGDTLLLTDSRLAAQLSLDDVVRAVAAGNAKATVKNLAEAARPPDCSALVLSAVAPERSALNTLKRNAPASIGRFLGEGHSQKTGYQSAKMTPPPEAPAGGSTPPLTHAAAGQPKSSLLRKLSPSSWRGRFAKNRAGVDRGIDREEPGQPPPQPPPFRSQARQKDDPSPKTTAPPPPPDRLHGPQEPGAREMDSLAHDPGFHPEQRHSTATAAPSLTAGRIFRRLGAGLLLLLALLGNGLKTILGLVLPGSNNQAPRRAGAQMYQHQSSAVSWKLLLNIVIAIPILVALIVGVSYIQKGRIQEAEYQELVGTAQSKFQQAQAVAADPAAALGLMAEAETALDEAEVIKGGQPEITALREQMRTAADQVTRVERLADLTQLRQYTDGGTNLKNIVVQGVEMYVLDAGTDRLFHHRLDDSSSALLPDDDSLLLAAREQPVEDIAVNELLAMTWMPAGGNRQTSDLVILNSTGLLEYNLNWGLTTAALASGELLTLPVAVSSYFGNFYILDPPTNRLLRYLPTADGYSAPPENYFGQDQAVNLGSAVDFSIDGAIYILFGDGRVGKYQAGQPVEFEVTGLVKPLNNPSAIFTAPQEEIQYVYIADAGNQRIVQLEKDGRFVRQFKPETRTAPAFSNLQDILVDEIGGRLYILDNNSLYMASLPNGGGAE